MTYVRNPLRSPSIINIWYVCILVLCFFEFILENEGGIINYILKCFHCYYLLNIFEDINLWGPLWKIIVENIPLL